ncbi:MAG: hypothetical protein Q8R13_00060 [bacterium]|nr:hypothetical protein [bacterium]MDZ4295873.1 hypothetical protein [Patescibacteria group bacterium]
MKMLKWLLIVGVVALSGWAAYGMLPKARIAWFLWTENQKLRSQVSTFDQESQALRERAQRLETARFIEQEAKVRLQLRRPGEEVLIVVEPAPATTTPEAPGAESRWSEWLTWGINQFLGTSAK